MSDDRNISCGPFWLLEQILRLTSMRCGCGFKRIIATSGWYRAHVGRPKLTIAIRFLKQLKIYDNCRSMNELTVKLFFYTFPYMEGETHGEAWYIQGVLQELCDMGVPLWRKSNKTTQTREPGQLVHYNETSYHLPLDLAIKYLERLRGYDLSAYNEELQVGFQFEIAPWRNTRPEQDGGCAIWHFGQLVFLLRLGNLTPSFAEATELAGLY